MKEKEAAEAGGELASPREEGEESKPRTSAFRRQNSQTETKSSGGDAGQTDFRGLLGKRGDAAKGDKKAEPVQHDFRNLLKKKPDS